MYTFVYYLKEGVEVIQRYLLTINSLTHAVSVLLITLCCLQCFAMYFYLYFAYRQYILLVIVFEFKYYLPFISFLFYAKIINYYVYTFKNYNAAVVIHMNFNNNNLTKLLHLHFCKLSFACYKHCWLFLRVRNIILHFSVNPSGILITIYYIIIDTYYYGRILMRPTPMILSKIFVTLFFKIYPCSPECVCMCIYVLYVCMYMHVKDMRMYERAVRCMPVCTRVFIKLVQK